MYINRDQFPESTVIIAFWFGSPPKRELDKTFADEINSADLLALNDTYLTLKAPESLSSVNHPFTT
ncbi:hypothetical protein E2C01_088129 [Portunus trituberculatus]|uniref:Uncharacterized protein n=1 Tax=Portunus trituberculatus TaxID=210409 RepID=A0A5B7JL39_PORTR|nr:hypothetical protein [Portunus trituberculatus]